jgi:hypothetical protein
LLAVTNKISAPSGVLVILGNTSGVEAEELFSITKTPDGADILFVTASNTTSVMSYYVAATDKVLVSYIGNFA